MCFRDQTEHPSNRSKILIYRKEKTLPRLHLGTWFRISEFGQSSKVVSQTYSHLFQSTTRLDK